MYSTACFPFEALVSSRLAMQLGFDLWDVSGYSLFTCNIQVGD